MPRRADDLTLDEHDRKVLDNVARHGLHITHVIREAGTPPWSFTVGLYPRHPEIVVFGLRQPTAQAVLNTAARHIRAGAEFAAGTESTELLEDLSCAFRSVAPMWHHPFLGWADWYHEGDDYPVVQCFWPDRAGRFPWEAGFDAAMASMQPLLFHADVEAAGAGDILATMGLRYRSD